MRRLPWVIVVGTVFVFLFAGVALAALQCPPEGTCFGTEDTDSILGTDGDDEIRALGGDDRTQSGPGMDRTFGGSGQDTLQGEDGDDTYFGGPDDDFIGEGGPQTGKDQMNGGDGGDFITGGLGADTIKGGPGDEFFEEFPNIFGDQGNDTIYGDAGNDGMQGEQGDDKLYGGPDNDFIDAADDESPNGNDFVDCGAGNDRVIANRNDQVAANCERVTRRPNPTAPTAQRSAVSEEDDDAQAKERWLTNHQGVQPVE